MDAAAADDGDVSDEDEAAELESSDADIQAEIARKEKKVSWFRAFLQQSPSPPLKTTEGACLTHISTLKW